VQTGPTFTVNPTADSHEAVCFEAAFGNCSLHDAIMLANAYALQHPAKRAAVQLGLLAIHSLTTVDNAGADGANALPVVLGKVSLLGAGADVERPSGAPSMRLLEVANSGRLTIQQVTLNGGSTAAGGGMLLNLGTATIGSSAVVANTAVGNGGAIFNRGKLTVDNSTLTANSGHDGGAIASNRGSVTLINDTLSGDSSAGVLEVAIAAGSSSFANTLVGATVGAHNAPVAPGIRFAGARRASRSANAPPATLPPSPAKQEAMAATDAFDETLRRSRTAGSPAVRNDPRVRAVVRAPVAARRRPASGAVFDYRCRSQY
jgi:hypothetical protein